MDLWTLCRLRSAPLPLQRLPDGMYAPDADRLAEFRAVDALRAQPVRADLAGTVECAPQQVGLGVGSLLQADARGRAGETRRRRSAGRRSFEA